MRAPRLAARASGEPRHPLSYPLSRELRARVLRAALHRVRSVEAETAMDREDYMRRLTWSRTPYVHCEGDREAEARIRERWARVSRPETRRGALHLVAP